jgi:radical SAM superfamily enzyme YgiQ (UPF0313 family)
MKPLKIYLGDLAYTTVSLATDAFPLNIGYVGAYCKKCYGDQVELTLFKYVDDLERTIHLSPPDILALSNYPWNHALGLEFFEMMHSLRTETLCVMGGSNIPHQPELQATFMRSKPMIDIYVYLEGEVGFSSIIGEIIRYGGVGSEKDLLKQKPIAGCLFINSNGEFVRGATIPRQKALDEIPSPYLTGLMDKFFDGKLSPMVETNRGCPFSCTFCHEGHSIFQKVNFFSMERVNAELEYIAQRVPATVHNLLFCDPNFGMYHRDVEICKCLAAIQARTGWPIDIFASTGKNNKERIANALYELKGTMQMWLSVQSMDQVVLDNIKRTNISLQEMMQIQSSLSANRLPSMSEIIMGLPGETYESHIRSIAELVTAGVDSISGYTLMLLNGTELNVPEERAKWGFISKFRVLPRDFAKLGNGKNVVEVEEVAIGSKDMSFEEYIALRRYHLIISVIYNGKPLAALFKLFRELKLDVFPLLKAALERISEAPMAVQKLVANFEQETRGELWDSEEELRAYYGQDENYNRLVSGDLGSNLIQKYGALSLFEAANEWARYVFLIVQDIVSDLPESRRHIILEQLDNSRRYCTARVRDLFGTDRLSLVYKETLDYDIEAWVADKNGKRLDEFKFGMPTRMKFVFTEEQYRITEDYIARFGRTQQGIGRILTKMNIMNAWRKCVPVDGSGIQRDEQPPIYYALMEEQASGGVTSRH